MKVLIPSGEVSAGFKVISSISEEHFKATGKDTVVLIDEFPNFFKSNFHPVDFLLKSSPYEMPHVHVVACGVHRLVDSPADFSIKYDAKDILIADEDIDNNSEFLNYFLGKVKDEGGKTSLHEKQNVVHSVLKLMLHFTGGHIYPFLKLCEHFITNFDVLQLDSQLMQQFVASQIFKESPLYKSIFVRCFDSGDIADFAVRVYGNEDSFRPYDDAVRHLREFGLWDDTKNFFISNLFETVVLNDYLKNIPEESLVINSSVEYEELKIMMMKPDDYESSDILEKVIIVGLSTMTEIDFVLPNGQNRLESAISHAFTKRLARLKSLHIAPSFQVDSGWIDYFLNGRINSYLELLRNGDRVQAHVDRFKKGGTYESVGSNGNYALLDIELKSLDPKSIELKIATPKFYTFVRMSNSLYLGSTLIKTNVASIPSPNIPINSSIKKRSFTTFKSTINKKLFVKLSRFAIFMLR